MPALVFYLICLLSLTGAPGVAHAESTAEYKQQRGLFVFEDFRHWATLQYDYNGHESRSNNTTTSSTTHAFRESYNASLNTAIVNQHLLDTSLQVGVLFDQNKNNTDTTSSSSSDILYQYTFSATGLDRSPTPFNLISFRNINTVQTPFAPSYVNDMTGNEFNISFLNTLVQSKFHFARNTQDNRGGGFESSSVFNTYAYSALNKYKDVSVTSLSVSFSDQSGSSANTAESRTHSSLFELSNTLSLGAQHDYMLLTSVQASETKTDNRPQRNLSLNETFQAALGRALSLDATYTLTNSHSRDLSNQLQESTKNQGEVSLKHKLFSSLETKLTGRASLDRTVEGTEDRYAGSVNIRYAKLLPQDSRLIVAAKKVYELVDRKFGSGTSTIIDEPHLSVHQGDVINLFLGDGTLVSVGPVMDKNNPAIIFVEGVDYTVNLTLGRIDIQSGSGVRIDLTGTGTDLIITYVTFRDPRIKYLNDSTSISADLGLFKSKYQLGAAYSEDKVSLISGPVNNSLQGSHSMMLYVTGSHDNFDYRLGYRKAAAGALSYQSIEGTGKASWESYVSALTLTATDHYNMYEATSTTVGYNENSAQLSVAYLRNLMTNARLKVQTTILDLRSDARGTKDSVSLQATCLIVLNKVIINLTLQTAWAFQSGGTTRDDAAHIDITRYF